MSNLEHNKSSHKQSKKSMVMLLALTAGYMIAEVVGGFVSNSLSLLADAGHMLADVVALSISLIAMFLAAKPPSFRASFGYWRAEVIAALFNGVALLIVAFFITKEAFLRFSSPEPIESLLMIGVAVGGLLVNLIGLWLLRDDKSHNLNIKGAWLHVLSDALSSVGVIISGVLIYFFGWYVADPLMSIAIAALVSYSALKLILETINVLMEHAPAHIDPREVKNVILSVPYASQVHDLHIWTITPGREALSVHVVMAKGGTFSRLLHDVEKVLAKDFGITHTTIQIEHNNE